MDTLQENGLPHSPALDIPGRESTAKEHGVHGTPLKTKGKHGTTKITSRVNNVTAESGNQQIVSLVNAPALPTTPLELPGVMDAEGRVDESRLRMHIFKNGKDGIRYPKDKLMGMNHCQFIIQHINLLKMI